MGDVALQEWRPNAGPQLEFLSCPAYEALYGGAAGGGKSDALLMGALRNIQHPSYRGLLLRRTFKELEKSLIDRALRWYPLVGGQRGDAGRVWRFPSGAVIEFGNLEHESDVHNYQSAEYQFIGFDEVTSFTERQYTYMLSRARSAAGIEVRIRAGTNPGNIGHEWVKRRWHQWLDESYKGPPISSGQVLHYRIDADGNEQWCERGIGTLSRVFFRSLVTDNPKLMDGDPQYVQRLRGLDVAERKRLLEGDWKAFEDPAALWRRDWFKRGRRIEPPPLRRILIAVDPSGSHRKTSDECGILVVGAGDCMCLGVPDVHLFVLEDMSGKYPPRDWAQAVVDAYHRYMADAVVAEENFGGAMVEEMVQLTAELDSERRPVNYKGLRASRGKHVRAEPVAGIYHQGRAHHCGQFTRLEDQLCTWNPMTSTESPGRLDALVWGGSELSIGEAPAALPDDDNAHYPRRTSSEATEDDDRDWDRDR